MKETNINTPRYAVFQSVYWLSLCSIAPFASAFLLDRNFTSSQIGITASLASLLSFLIAPMVGSFADKSKKVFIARIIAGFALLGALLEVGLLFRLPMVLTAGMYLLTMCSVYVNQPLVYAVCVYYNDRGKSINFGMARGIGSGVYAVFSYALGVLVTRFGYNVLMIFGIAMFLTLFAMTTRLHPVQRMTAGAAQQAEESPTAMKDIIKRYPVFFLLLSGSMLMFVFHTYVTTLFYQVVERAGGDAAAMGFSNALCAAVEVPFMFAYARLAKRFGTSRMLALAGVFFAVKALAFMLANSMLTINAAQCFQALSYAIYVPACIEFTNRMMAPADQNKGQTMAAAAQTAGAVIGGMTGGMIIDTFGVQAMLATGFGCAAVGAVIVVTACRMSRLR